MPTDQALALLDALVREHRLNIELVAILRALIDTGAVTINCPELETAKLILAELDRQ